MAAPTSAVSTVTITVASVANAVTSTWNSLPPWAQVGIAAAVSVLAVAATGGIDLPAVAAIDSETIGSILTTGAALAGLPVVAMTTEDVAPGVDPAVVAALAEMGQHERALTAQGQLAKVLGGTTDVERLPLPNGFDDTSMLRNPTWRTYDVKAPGPYADPVYRELKLGSDPVTPVELNKDIYLNVMNNVNVVNDLVPDPVTGKGPSPTSLARLTGAQMLFRIWGPEFWNGFGPS